MVLVTLVFFVGGVLFWAGVARSVWRRAADLRSLRKAVAQSQGPTVGQMTVIPTPGAAKLSQADFEALLRALQEERGGERVSWEESPSMEP